MNIEKSKISCISRTYLIKSGEVEIEIESHGPLEGEDIEVILEKDDLLNMPLKKVLQNGRIVSCKTKVSNLKEMRKIHEKRSEKRKAGTGSKINRRIPAEFNPKERIIIMSNMEDILTRLSYQKYAEEKCKIKMGNYMAHGDIEQARRDGIIEPTGQKLVNPATGRKIPSYRIINRLPIDGELENRLRSKEEKVLKSSIFRKA